jgi:hypothetical protein
MSQESYIVLGLTIAGWIFLAGGAFFGLRQVRLDIASCLKDLRGVSEREERRFRQMLVILTSMNALLPDNPGSKARIMDALQKMANGGGVDIP